MSSIVIDEPVSPNVILLAERSGRVEYQGEVFTIYFGTIRLAIPLWRRVLHSPESSRGPSEQNISDSVFHSVESLFAKQLSGIRGIERIFVRKDDDFFRVWVVVPTMDLALEDQVYASQFVFMDRFKDIPFDFTVIFREDKDAASIRPSGARLVYPTGL